MDALAEGLVVIWAVCPADGLVVATGVTLNLGGATLRGQGAGAGVRIEAGATDVTLRLGRVTGFATGVRGEGTTGVRVANVQVLDSAQDGVNLTGEGHTVEIAVIQSSGGLGVAVVGDAGRLSRLQVQSNGRAGVRDRARGEFEHSGTEHRDRPADAGHDREPVRSQPRREQRRLRHCGRLHGDGHERDGQHLHGEHLRAG